VNSTVTSNKAVVKKTMCPKGCLCWTFFHQFSIVFFTLWPVR